tara:strand:+ start:2900 stop:4321 length:1422 start_codon:yes stop_codon:yes gene_type:complete
MTTSRKINKFGFTYEPSEFKELFDPDYKYCSLLWSHISNEPGGTVRTCCIAKDRIKDEHGKDYNLGEHSMLEILSSQTMREMRDRIRDGEDVSNCETCWIDEANGKESKRQQYNNYYKEWYGEDCINFANEPERLMDVQLIFDNTCNLKCRSCNTNYSSKWREESIDRNIPFWETTAEINMNDIERSAFWKTMDDWTKDVMRMEIMGGEPFYMKEFKQFVDYLIDTGRSKNVALTLSTNGTIADKDFLDKMVKNFRDIAFSVSIDGVEDKFTYLRHPGKWDEVKANLDYYYELHNSDHPVFVQITHTVTALNILYLPDFHEYFKTTFPNFKIWNNSVHYPKWISPPVLPKSAKELITDKLLKYEWLPQYKEEANALVNFMNSPLYANGESVVASLKNKFDAEKLKFFDERSSQQKWTIFKSQIVGGDIYREENFVKVFPELYDLIKHEFDYDTEFEAVSTAGFLPVSQGEYSN